MRIQIRNSVFETNSSSIHTIAITKYNGSSKNNITLEAQTGNFGWEHELYMLPKDKLSYLWTAIYCLADDEAWGEEKDFVKHAQILEDWKKIISPVFAEYNIEIEYKHVDPFSFDYDIDHGYKLNNMLEDFKNNPKLMVDFVMGEKSVIETYNDNGEYDILTPDADYIYEYEKRN